MTPRAAKLALIFAIALYYALVVFNNLADYGSNYQFVRHVLRMDTTFSGNHGLWRALERPVWHTLFYLWIIGWETVTSLLCGWGGWRLAKAFGKTPAEFHRAKRWAIAGLTLGSLLWLVAFLSAGGEWFLMWQSKLWNGQEAAFRMFTVTAFVLLLVALPEVE